MFFMKINKTDRVLQIYNNLNTSKVNQNRNKPNKDEIKLSEKAIDYQFAINKLREVPEMRMDKVNKLKEAIQSGSYNIEGRKIVEKIYQDIHLDKRV